MYDLLLPVLIAASRFVTLLFQGDSPFDAESFSNSFAEHSNWELLSGHTATKVLMMAAAVKNLRMAFETPHDL